MNDIIIYICDFATHLDPFISSTNKKNTVNSAKSCIWRSFNIYMSDFRQLSCAVHQMSLILNLKRFWKFVSTCLGTSNCIVKIITEIAIRSQLSCSEDNYRELLDSQATFNLKHFEQEKYINQFKKMIFICWTN